MVVIIFVVGIIIVAVIVCFVVVNAHAIADVVVAVILDTNSVFLLHV